MSRLFPELPPPGSATAVVPWRTSRTRGDIAIACCGFGLAAAGAGAAAILAGRPDDACLVGLGGTYDVAEAPVGSVVAADAVHVAGLGLPPSSAPRAGLDAELGAEVTGSGASPVVPEDLRPHVRVGGVLSAAMPSAGLDEARLRAAEHPRALVEDMEAHAALLATELLGRKLVVIRGVSNVAGERDKSRWEVDRAARALRATLDAWLA